MATKIFSIVATPSLTVNLTIKRAADNYYWTGTAWQSDAATVAMTENADIATGYSEYYSTTSPTAVCFWWAIDSSSTLWERGEYDPTQTTSATSSTIAPDKDDLKEFLQIPSADEGDDTYLTNCVNRAGDFVERYCQRRFASSSRTYIVDGHGLCNLYLPDWPITAVTSIYGPCAHAPRHFGDDVESSELVDSDYYRIAKSGYSQEQQDHLVKILGHWTYGFENYQVIATTGYSSMPADLYQASIEVAAHIYQLGKQGNLGLTNKSVDGGSLQYEVERGIPLSTRIILDKYKRWSV